MKLINVGLTWKTAPLQVLEQAALSPQELSQILVHVKGTDNQSVVLSTCNRTEIYTLAHSAKHAQGFVEGLFVEGLVDRLGKNSVINSRYLSTMEHSEAMQHLLRVVCGLDSFMLGETEILGQVRNAYSMASQAGVVGGTLGHIFHQALRVGKRAQTETAISKNPLSVSAACVELARRAVGNLQQKTVLVIGLGTAGKLATQALRTHGAKDLWFTNRTYERAVQEAADWGGTSIPFDQLESTLAHADVVVSTTGSPNYVLTKTALQKIMAGRSGKPLFIADIALPRDVDPDANSIPGITICDMRDLQAISEENRSKRQLEAVKVEAIIEAEIKQFLEWWDSRRAIPTINSLRQRAEVIRQVALSKTLKSLPNLPLEDQKHIEMLTKSLVNKLLHAPITYIRDHNTEGDLRIIEQFFKLDQKEDSA